MPPSTTPTTAPSIKHSSCNLFQERTGQVHFINCPCGRVLHLVNGVVECEHEPCKLRHIVSVQTFKGVRP